MRVVAVTGATSFLGLALVHGLIASGDECYAIVRPNSPRKELLPKHPRIHVVDCELSDKESWVRAIKCADLFYHLGWAGIGARGRADFQTQEQNIAWTLTCLEGAAQLKCSRFIFAGSQAEYGVQFALTDEAACCKPETEYGRAKLAVLEQAGARAKELGVEYVHMRIFSVYGKGDHAWALVPTCIRCFTKNERVDLSDCLHKWNYLHCRDAAQAMIALSECPLDQKSPVYNVASTDTRTLKAFVQEIWELTGYRGEPAFGQHANMIEKPVGINPSVEKLQSATGWMPRISFSEGIRELVALEEIR